jgi:hypothetical protein
MENIYTDIRVVGGQEEVIELFKVLYTIQRLGRVGASRDLLVSVDGDGSARLEFFLQENGSLIPFDEMYKNIKINLDEDIIKFEIGE